MDTQEEIDAYVQSLLKLPPHELENVIEDSIYYKVDIEKNHLPNARLSANQEREELQDELFNLKKRIEYAQAVILLYKEANIRQVSIKKETVQFFSPRYFISVVVGHKSKITSLLIYAFHESVIIPYMFHKNIREYMNGA